MLFFLLSKPSHKKTLNVVLFVRSSFSSSSPIPQQQPPPPPTLPPTIPFSSSPNLTSSITSALYSWFKPPSPPLSLYDSIYSILSSTPEGPPLHSALSSLRLPPLSESLVLSLLSHTPHPSLSRSRSHLLLLRLKFFDWAGHQAPYRHTRSAFHAIFKTLLRASQSNTILQWLDHFSSSSHSHSHTFTRFHDTLVIGYSVAGRPERALHIFAKMRFQGLDLDSYSYHVLFNSLIDSCNFDFADAIAAQIDARGFNGPVTQCIKLKGLCNQGKIDEALEFVRGVVVEEEEEGTRSSPALGIMVSTLVNGLCKKGQFEEAGELVDEFGSEEVYGSWIGNLLRGGKLDSALKFLQRKKVEEEYSAEDTHYNVMVLEFMKKNKLKEVYEVLVEMIEEGIVPNKATMNIALSFFCKAGFIEVALRLYQSRLELGLSPTKWLYNHLISGLCKSGRVDEVCHVLEESLQQGYFPDKRTFRVVADMLAKEMKLDQLYDLLNGAFENLRKPSTSVLARSIAILCKGGKLEKAWAVGDLFGERGVPLRRYRIVYYGFIEAFITLENVDWVPELVIQMQKDGHLVSRRLYKDVICCLCKLNKFSMVLDLLDKQLELNVSDPRTFYNYFIEGVSDAGKSEMVREVYNRMVIAGVQPNNDTEFVVLTGYIKCRRINDAVEFFKHLHDTKGPRTKLYNVFISALCEAKRLELAVEYWKEMREEGLIPSLNCYEGLVVALCNAGDYHTVVKVFEDLHETGRPLSSFICNCLLLHTLKGGELLNAWVNFKKEDASRGVGMLIQTFAGAIRMKKDILQNLDEYMETLFPVDVFTYNMLLRALTLTGQMDYARDLVCRMQKKGHEPNIWTYDIMVHGYCKQGNKEEARMWFKELTRYGYHLTWYTMGLYNETFVFPKNDTVG